MVLLLQRRQLLRQLLPVLAQRGRAVHVQRKLGSLRLQPRHEIRQGWPAMAAQQCSLHTRTCFWHAAWLAASCCCRRLMLSRKPTQMMSLAR